ncbi:hypothetical protein Malapachy_1275 [Malassezia pachydermatis]|uniref:Uncharacterized protein n=1 Tax=Malassezia pachydermatis TaxID=77020 RepID=A0A0M8MQV2_9BASI|nr:hypothetical protein Malapachy_1275 [Malassezia pachydermatis]KOS14997.1 hypothetical protein Malapachy_1275 [Malassezia pachydermatis]
MSGLQAFMSDFNSMYSSFSSGTGGVESGHTPHMSTPLPTTWNDENQFNDLDKRLQERIRVLELRIMQLERQVWRRPYASSSMALPFTPTSEASLSSTSSSCTDTLATPSSGRFKSYTPLDHTVARCPSTPDPFNPFWPILEEEESIPLPGRYWD